MENETNETNGSSELFENWTALSSGNEDGDTIFSFLFDFLGTAGDWAGAVSDLLGLL